MMWGPSRQAVRCGDVGGWSTRTCGRRSGTGLRPLQLGVRTPGGAEAEVLALSWRRRLAEDHEMAVNSVDTSNAVNGIRRKR